MRRWLDHATSITCRGLGARCAPSGEREGRSRLANSTRRAQKGSARGKAASQKPHARCEREREGRSRLAKTTRQVRKGARGAKPPRKNHTPGAKGSARSKA